MYAAQNTEHPFGEIWWLSLFDATIKNDSVLKSLDLPDFISIQRYEMVEKGL